MSRSVPFRPIHTAQASFTTPAIPVRTGNLRGLTLGGGEVSFHRRLRSPRKRTKLNLGNRNAAVWRLFMECRPSAPLYRDFYNSFTNVRIQVV